MTNAFTNYSSDGYNVLANSLSRLGETFGKAIEQQGKLQSSQAIGQKITSGNLMGAAQQAFEGGDINTGLQLYKQADEQKWLSELSPQLYGSGNSTTLSPIAPTSTQPGTPMNLPSAGGGQSRGDLNNNSGNIEDGPFAQRQPGYAGSDGRFAKFSSPMQGFEAQTNLLGSYGRQGVTTINGIINKWAPSSENGNQSTANYVATVSRELGVSPDTPLDLSDANLRATVARAMAAVEQGHRFAIPDGTVGGYAAGGRPTQPVQVAQNNQSASANPGVANDGGAAPSNNGQPLPYNSSSWREVGIKTSKILANPGFSRSPAAFQEQVKLANAQAAQWMQIENNQANLPANKMTAEAAVRRQQGVAAGLTGKALESYTMTGDPNKLDSPFQKGMSEASAKRWSGLIEEGDKARANSADIEQLAELNKKIGPSNDLAGWRGYIAETFGIAIGPHIDDIQVMSSLIDKLAPQMRVPGSGASSDLDVKGMKASLPSLMKSPEGRAQIIHNMQGLNQYSIDRSIIAERLDNQEINQSEAAKLMRNLRASEYVKTGGRPNSVSGIFGDEQAIPRANPTPEGKPLVHRRDQPQQPQQQQQNNAPTKRLSPSDIAAVRQRMKTDGTSLEQTKAWLASQGFSAEGL